MNVDAYLAAQPQETRAVLAKVRSTIKKALPRATERISYRIPTYEIDGTMVLYFAGFAKHWSIYPATPALLRELGEELADRLKSKTLRFTYEEPFPARLVARIAKVRAAEAAAHRRGLNSARAHERLHAPRTKMASKKSKQGKTAKAKKKTATSRSKTTAKTTAKKVAKKVAKKASRTAKPAKAKTTGIGDALLRALTVAMIADGEMAASERQVLERFTRAAVFRGVDVAAVVNDTIDRCIAKGPGPVLADVAAKIRTKDDRETAFASCLAVVATDGRATASEVRMLKALAQGLRITSARARQLAGPMAPVLA